MTTDMSSWISRGAYRWLTPIPRSVDVWEENTPPQGQQCKQRVELCVTMTMTAGLSSQCINTKGMWSHSDMNNRRWTTKSSEPALTISNPITLVRRLPRSCWHPITKASSWIRDIGSNWDGTGAATVKNKPMQRWTVCNTESMPLPEHLTRS